MDIMTPYTGRGKEAETEHIVYVCLQIPVLANLPVGKALEDHVLSTLVYTFNQSITPTPQQFGSFETLSPYIFTGQGTVLTNCNL